MMANHKTDVIHMENRVSKHQETNNIFSQNSVQLVHCMTNDNKMNKCIFFLWHYIQNQA